MADAVLAPPAAVSPGTVARPLVIDLDGSLLRTDSTLESVLALARHPLTLLRLLPSLRRGRAVFKQRLAAATDLDVAWLPYNQPLLAYLREERAAGRRLVLATGADRKTADAVARHFGLFDGVLASDGKINLTGSAKLAAIRATLGGAAFTYIGNSATDLRVWCEAAGAICVDARPSVARAAAQLTAVERIFPREAGWPALLLRALRWPRWAANLLVFVPLLAGRGIPDAPGWLAAATAFIAFCCAASGLQLALDLTDLTADRRDPARSRQPFASGTLPLHIGVIAALVIFLLGAALSLAAGALPVMVVYVGLSWAHGRWLKSRRLPGALAQAALLGLRVLAGCAATGYTLLR